MFGIVSRIVIGLLGSVYGITAAVVSSIINTTITGTLVVKTAAGNLITIAPDAANPSITSSAGTFYVQAGAAGDMILAAQGIGIARLTTNGFGIGGNYQISSIAGANAPTTATSTIGLQYAAAGVWKVTNGTTGTGWLQNSAGEAALANAYTNATASFTSTNLSVTVIAGRSYRIQACLQVSDSTAADGGQFDFNGGAASATTFFASSLAVGSVVAGVQSATALATALTYTTITGTDYIWITGFLKVNAGGTLILRGAQTAHTAGTLTIGAGSWMALYDTVPL